MLLRVMLLALLLASAVAADKAVASVGLQGVWHQNLDRIFVEVAVDCVADRNVSITNDTFALSCTSPNGPAFLSFTLREQIIGTESSCVSAGGREVCSLLKEIPHQFDRLTRGANELTTVLVSEWTKWKQLEDHGLDAFDEYENADFPKWEMPEFIINTAENDLSIVDAEAPWCIKCMHIKKPFMELAKALKGQASLGFVDTRETHELRSVLQPECTHVCRVTVLKRGEPPRRVEFKNEPKEYLRTFSAYVGPLVTPLDTPNALKDLKKKNKVVVVGVGLDAAQAKRFAEAGREVRGHVRLASAADGATIGKTAVPKGPHLVALRRKDKPEIFPFPAEDRDLAKLLLAGSMPRVVTFSYDLTHNLEELGLPIARVWVEEGQLGLYEKVAEEFRGLLTFVHMPPAENKHLLVDYGLAQETPAFGISGTVLWDSAKYAFEGEHTHDNIAAFCKQVLARTHPVAVKSDPLPPPLELGSLGKIATRNLRQYLDGDSELLLILFKSWVKDWKGRNITLHQIARCAQPANVLVATIDVANNFLNQSEFPNAASPDTELEAFLYTGSGPDRTRHHYRGSWTRKDTLRFLKTHSPSIQKQWAAVVAESEKIAVEIKAAEEAARQARAAEQAKWDAFPKEELVADGGVIKQTMTQGTGEPPAAGAKVKAHYTGTLEKDGSEFDSSRSRGQPFEFTLGKSQVIKCWDTAFATMRVGERALLTCRSEYAYGPNGSPPRIPPDATLQFDVELVSYQGHDEL
eukprot:m.236691 g.236691  ORF g.236691 m.236691 type:complete len:749 (-) comp20704_c0_seq1:117-2363(-)